MRDKVCRRVEIWVYVFCVSENEIDFMFHCEEKAHLRSD